MFTQADTTLGLKQKHRLQELESLVSSIPLRTAGNLQSDGDDFDGRGNIPIVLDGPGDTVGFDGTPFESDRSQSLPSESFPTLTSDDNVYQPSEHRGIQPWHRQRNSSNVTRDTASTGVSWLSSQSGGSFSSSFSSTKRATEALENFVNNTFVPSQAVSPTTQNTSLQLLSPEFVQVRPDQQGLSPGWQNIDIDMMPNIGSPQLDQLHQPSFNFPAHNLEDSQHLGLFHTGALPIRSSLCDLGNPTQSYLDNGHSRALSLPAGPEPTAKYPHQTPDPDETFDFPRADPNAEEAIEFTPADLEILPVAPSHPPRRPTMWPSAFLDEVATSSSQDPFKPPCPYINHIRLDALTCLAATLANAETLGITADMYFSSTPSPFYRPRDRSRGPSSPPHISSALAFPNIKRDLRPTRIQLLRPHASYLDLLIFPLFRNWVIELATTDNGLFDEEELIADLMNDGLVCWGNVHGRFKGGGGCPWDMRSWEAKRWFLEKWWGFVDVETDEMWSVSQWWWEMHD